MSQSRRAFLTGTLAVAATSHPALSRRHQADGADLPRPKLGFSLYGMKGLSVPEGLRACQEIGYQTVELALMPGWPADPAQVAVAERKAWRSQLTDANLALAGLMENLPAVVDDAAHRNNLDRLKQAAELGHDLTEETPIVETILGSSPPQWNDVRQRMADRLTDWAAVAEASDCVLAVKPHVAGALHRPEDAVWLLEQVNHERLRLTFDFSHYQLRGYSLADCWKLLAGHTQFIHIKDARGDAAKFEFLLPGESGAIDYGDYFRRLTASDYRGSVVVEVSGQISGRSGYDPIAAARQAHRNLSRI